MVLDTSAVIAIILREPEADQFEAAIDRHSTLRISASSVLESAIVLRQRFGEDGVRNLDRLLAKIRVTIEPFDMQQLAWARHALETYGRGRHPAKLNFGDCFTYALAKSTGEPLLFKGSDFSLTDLKSAV